MAAMNQVSRVLRRGQTGFFHWCPACEQMHPLPDGKNSPGGGWTFDGDAENPTFTPSFKQTYTHWSGGIAESGLGIGERTERVCHYIITAGKIQFCADSWHRRSDIVVMPPIPEGLTDE